MGVLLIFSYNSQQDKGITVLAKMLNYWFIIIKRTGYLHKKHYANKWKELVHDDQNDFLK